MRGWYVPALQLVQDAAPAAAAAANEPAPQGRQAAELLAPGEALKSPSGQALHVAALVAPTAPEKVPAVQLRHAVALEAPKVPLYLLPLGTYGEGTGLSACTPCPPGTTTALVGAASVAQCAAATFTCPLGFEPPAFTPAARMEDCAPLVCPPFLALAPSGAGCSVCAPGSAGTPPGGCAPCASS